MATPSHSSEPAGDPQRFLRTRIVVALVLLAAAFATAKGGAQPLVRKLNELARSAPARATASTGHSGALAAGSAFAATDDAMPRPGEIARALRAKVEQQTPILLAQLVAALVVFGFFYLLQRIVVRLMRGENLSFEDSANFWAFASRATCCSGSGCWRRCSSSACK